MTDAERQTRRRARYRCEYCLLPQSASRLRHHVDHIVARQHGGSDELSNLALSCIHCNLHKGPNLAGIDPVTKELVRLYHPRRDRWREHFTCQNAILVGLTPTGRATVQVLAINEPALVAVREALILEGRLPTR